MNREFIKIGLPNLPLNTSMLYEESIKKEIKKENFSIYAVMGIDEAVDLGILDKACYLDCRDMVERAWIGETKAQGLRQSELMDQTKYLR